MLSASAADDRERSRLVGLWAAVGGIALPIGPLLGGLLVDVGNWRAVFWLNLPVILLALIPIIVHYSPSTVPGAGGSDAAGNAGPSEPSHPMRARFAIACLVAGLLNFCVLGSLFLLTQYFQDDRGLSPFQAGLATLPALLPLPFFGAVSARISSRLGVWKTSAAGLIVAGVGLGLMGLMVSGPRLWALSFALVVWAIGVGILMPAIVAAAMQALPRRPGFASGTGSTARNLGGALGVAVFAALHEVDRGVLMAGVGVAMAAAALLCLRVQRTQFSKVHFASVGSEGSGHSGSG